MNGPTAPRTFRMQRPTDNLRAEHAVAVQGLESLRAIGAFVAAHGAFPAKDVATLLRFLREFLLAIHMRKEVEVVWPALAMRGDDRAAAQIGELFRLHAEVTELVHSLVLFWEPVDDLSPAERQGFANTVAALVARVRHMQRIEENVLFAACDAAVPADDQLDWVSRFAEFEAGRADRRTWARRLAPIARAWLS